MLTCMSVRMSISMSTHLSTDMYRHMSMQTVDRAPVPSFADTYLYAWLYAFKYLPTYLHVCPDRCLCACLYRLSIEAPFPTIRMSRSPAGPKSSDSCKRCMLVCLSCPHSSHLWLAINPASHSLSLDQEAKDMKCSRTRCSSTFRLSKALVITSLSISSTPCRCSRVPATQLVRASTATCCR